MAQFNPVVPNAQLGIVNIADHSLRTTAGQRASRKGYAQLGMQLKQQEAQLQMAQEAQGHRQAAAEQAQLARAQGMQLKQQKLSQEQSEKIMDGAADVFNQVRDASPEEQQDALAGYTMNLLQRGQIDKAQATKMAQMLNDPRGFQALTTELKGRYSQSKAGLAEIRARGKAGALGGSGKIKLGTSNPQKFRGPDGQVTTAHIVDAGPDHLVGKYMGPEGPIPSDWENITQKTEREQAQWDSNLAVTEARRKEWEENKSEYLERNEAAYADASQNVALLDEAYNAFVDSEAKTGTFGNTVAAIDGLKKFMGWDIPSNSPKYLKDVQGLFKNRMATKYFADQKGSISEKEFDAIFAGVPDLSKSAQGNAYLIAVERALADWERRRAAKSTRLIANDPTISAERYTSEMQKWDQAQEGKIIPASLMQDIKDEIRDNKQLTWADVVGSATERGGAPTPEPADEFSYKSAIQAMEQELDN